MPKFRKKPVVIEAMQFPGTENKDAAIAFDDWMMPLDPKKTARYKDGDMLIITAQGQRVRARPGDWIIRGMNGEFYPCKPDIFEATYEAVV